MNSIRSNGGLVKELINLTAENSWRVALIKKKKKKDIWAMNMTAEHQRVMKHKRPES